jgi:hypothetical protein
LSLNPPLLCPPNCGAPMTKPLLNCGCPGGGGDDDDDGGGGGGGGRWWRRWRRWRRWRGATAMQRHGMGENRLMSEYRMPSGRLCR